MLESVKNIMRMRVLLTGAFTVASVSLMPACFGQAETAPSWTDPQGSGEPTGNGFNSGISPTDGTLRGPISPADGTIYSAPVNTMTVPAAMPLPASMPIPAASKAKSSGDTNALGFVDKATKTNLGMVNKALKTNIGLTDKAAKVNLGMTHRAAKASLGATDRAAKAGIALPGKALKTVFKGIF